MKNKTSALFAFSKLRNSEVRKQRIDRSSYPEVFYKEGVVKISQNSHENTCARVSILIQFQALACSFIKKETLA